MPGGNNGQDIESTIRGAPSFEHLQWVLDSCPYLALVLNSERRIVFFNRALLALTGKTEGWSAVGRRLGEVTNCVHTQDNQECGAAEGCQTCGAYQAVTKGLEDISGSREFRLTRVVDGKSESLEFQVTASPIRIGNERFVICSMRDISHEKRREVLERIFFHDVLNSASALELLARALQASVVGEATQFAEQIRTCASQLVEEILSHRQLLAAENDELAVSPVTIRTGGLLETLVERYRLDPLTRLRRIEIAPGSDDVSMETDASILRRVLQNMVKNALEATPPGAAIQIGCRDLGDEVEFQVHNPGAMPKPVTLQVFQRSFSTKGIGRGLGTYSMKLLTERYLKGAVSFRSSEEGGTTFLARYPRQIGDVPRSRSVGTT